MSAPFLRRGRLGIKGGYGGRELKAEDIGDVSFAAWRVEGEKNLGGGEYEVGREGKGR